MRNNVITVLLFGKEICKVQWQGGYKQGFGKVGSVNHLILIIIPMGLMLIR